MRLIKTTLLLSLLSFPLSVYSKDPLTIVAVGDIMMGSEFPESRLPPDDGEGIFSGVLEHFQNADLVFGNLEGPLADGGVSAKCGNGKNAPANGKTGDSQQGKVNGAPVNGASVSTNGSPAPAENGNGESKPRPVCYAFRTPSHYAKRLRDAGFNVLSVANNHANDFGPEGLASTLSILEEHRMQPAGGSRVAHFEVEGRRVAVAGFSYTRPTDFSYPLQDIEGARKIVQSLRQENDIVIVSFHGGAEGRGATQVKDEDEIFLNENRGNSVQFAHAVIDAGASLVIGHGPHVLRALELYKGKLIAYSLGNFLTYGRFNLSGPSGITAILRVDLDSESGNFVRGSVAPVKLVRGGLPESDAGREAIALLKGLTLARGAPAPGISDTGEILLQTPSQIPNANLVHGR